LRAYWDATEIIFDIYITFVMSIKDTRDFQKMKRIIWVHHISFSKVFKSFLEIAK
jgi:hypothetical protein